MTVIQTRDTSKPSVHDIWKKPQFHRNSGKDEYKDEKEWLQSFITHVHSEIHTSHQGDKVNYHFLPLQGNG